MSTMSGLSAKQRKQQAMALLQAGRVVEAREIFEGLSRDARRDPEVWHLLAACHCMLGDYARCESFARKAIELLPSFSGAWSNLGTSLHAQGRLTEAEAALREAIKRAPADAQALSNLGNVYREMKKADEAERCYREALRHRPDYADALTNLGLVMQDLNNFTEAAALHRRALTLDPQHEDAHYNLGYALLLQGESKSAIPFLERVTQMRPGEMRGWVSLGSAYGRTQESKQAALCYEHVVGLDPQNAGNLSSLGVCYLGAGEHEKGIAALTRALELNPSDDEARFWLAAAGTGEAPEKVAAETVAQLFDGYAGNFDEHLVGKLQYRTPGIIGATLRRVRGNDMRPLDLLDIGCGTGLLGVELRDIAGHLAGVDLSPKMIEQARRRGIYQELAVQDIVAYMEEAPQRYDAVLSADVFVYIGDLESVFSAATQCLSETGFFLFSVESHMGDEPYHLRETGRYAHSLPYLRELSARHGFEEISADTVTLRLEKHQPVEGYVIALRRM
jgi:predicted TPR repeat methyltransferase